MFLEVIVQSGEADTLCAPEPRSTDSLGTQHCTNFESHSNRVTFETNAISITSSIHAHQKGKYLLPKKKFKWKFWEYETKFLRHLT